MDDILIYNSFDELFVAQSSTRNDVSIFNDNTTVVHDAIEGCGFKLDDSVDSSIYCLVYNGVADCCDAAVKLAKCSLKDSDIKQKCNNDGLDGYARSLLNYVLKNRSEIGEGHTELLSGSINSKFRLKFEANTGSECHTLLFEGRTEGINYDTIDEVQVNEGGNSIDAAVDFFPVVGDGIGFLDSISNCLNALRLGILEFCDFACKISDK